MPLIAIFPPLESKTSELPLSLRLLCPLHPCLGASRECISAHPSPPHPQHVSGCWGGGSPCPPRWRWGWERMTSNLACGHLSTFTSWPSAWNLCLFPSCCPPNLHVRRTELLNSSPLEAQLFALSWSSSILPTLTIQLQGNLSL